jgi:alkanesulfonate monooxygenase SsuD/methylene tetrahydromethanopterin reductase-like flavin-dependent oxidoreductase (luciferase family)
MALKISVELAHNCALEEIALHADALESHGCYRVWVPDTIVSAWEAWLAAGIIVQRTRRIQIGLGVINPYTHHPVSMAQMAATMQHLSKGRLALSIGKGIPRFLEKAGIEQKPSAVEECITIIRGLLAGDRTGLKGEAFQIDGMRLRTAPLEKPVPIYAAAIGPAAWDAALRAADGIATIWNDKLGGTLKQAMSKRQLPVAALVPFSLSEGGFPEGWKGLSSPDELSERVDLMERLGIDEVIVAYRELADLEAISRLIKAGA